MISQTMSTVGCLDCPYVSNWYSLRAEDLTRAVHIVEILLVAASGLSSCTDHRFALGGAWWVQLALEGMCFVFSRST